MQTFFERLPFRPSDMIELGLEALDAGLKTAQSVINTLTFKSRAERLSSPPLEGPVDLDQSVSEFVNRLVMIAQWTPLDELGTTPKQIARALRESFHNVDLLDPRNVTLPLDLALSTGTLITQQALRIFSTYQVVGSSRYPEFVANVVEMFCEMQVFAGVHYDRLLARYRHRLERVPTDTATRVELGRLLIKCGIYEAAIAELKETAKDPAFREISLHESSVAFYRMGKFHEAALAASEALSVDPDNERVRSWCWLAAQSLGQYPEQVPEEHRMQVRVGYDEPSVKFENIAARIGLDKTSAGRGVAVFDYDSDGYLDVMITAAHGGCSLFRNNGDGTFSDVSIESGLDEITNGFIIAVGDYDNDGYPDVFVTRTGFLDGDSALYHNNGDGTFTDVTDQAGVFSWGPGFTACWVDYNNDGYLDLFVTNNLGGLFDRKVPNRLFRNNGDGTFTDVTREAGLRTIWPTIGATWGDYNNDGFPDLFLGNVLGRPQLYRNNGDGTFSDVSRGSGLDDHNIAAVAFWCDIDNDGWLDLVHFAWSDHEDVIYTMRHGQGPENGRPTRVYRNNRDGTFTNISPQLGIDGCWGTMSGNCGDFNNDGWLDLVMGNGSPRMDRLEPMCVLEHQADGKFHNVTFAAGFPFTGKGHGGTLADLFGDGRLSILMASGGSYPGDLLTTSVHCPKELPGNYLNVRLVGIKSNRSAIGARLCLWAGGRAQNRQVGGGTNFGCMPFEQHFGLGNLSAVDSLEIRWPSGLSQRFENLPVNTTIQLEEGQSSYVSVYPQKEPQLQELVSQT